MAALDRRRAGRGGGHPDGADPRHDRRLAARRPLRRDLPEVAMTGFLGTRADVFMNLAIAFFVAAPVLMTYAIRLAARGRYRAHHNLQAGLVVAGTVAVLLLEAASATARRWRPTPERLLRYAGDQMALLRPSLVRDTMVHWLVRPHRGFPGCRGPSARRTGSAGRSPARGSGSLASPALPCTSCATPCNRVQSRCPSSRCT